MKRSSSGRMSENAERLNRQAGQSRCGDDRMKHRHGMKAAMSGAIILGAALFLVMAAGLAQTKLPALRVSVGQAAPNFSLPATNGKTMSLSSFRGHTVLLDFYEGYW